MVKLVNRAKMTIASTGSSTLALGSAVDGFQSFADAGVTNGDTVRYVIEDGDAWEIGFGIYAASNTSLSRTVSESSNGGAPVALSVDAVVFVSAIAADIVQPGDSITKLANTAGYTTNVGDITNVTAGAGLSGGGASGSVSLSHADTSSQGSLNNAGATVIQDVTLDTYGHVTALGPVTITPALIGAATSSHAHIIADVSGLQTTLNTKASVVYVDTAVASLVDTAPSTLDTLNELAAALGDDPNFATTVSNQIGTKLNATANAVSASKWQTARTIALAGDLSGSAALDGTSNITISATVADDSHNHTVANVNG
jgi:hypothetical protein